MLLRARASSSLRPARRRSDANSAAWSNVKRPLFGSALPMTTHRAAHLRLFAAGCGLSALSARSHALEQQPAAGAQRDWRLFNLAAQAKLDRR